MSIVVAARSANVLGTIGLPTPSTMPESSCNVYGSPGTSGLVGVNVAVVDVELTVPAAGVVEPVTPRDRGLADTPGDGLGERDRDG